MIIPTYNRRELLSRTLSQLCLQSTPKDQFEVIVVDDGSSDGTEDEVIAFRDQLQIRYFWQADEGFRAAAARNVGIRHARGGIAVFLDSGVFPHSHCIESHIAAHEVSQRRKAFIGYVYGFDSKDGVCGEVVRELEATEIDLYIERSRPARERQDSREMFYRYCHDDIPTIGSPWGLFWTCNVSARVTDLRAVGMFDEIFCSWGVEDIELGYRLHQCGVQIELCRAAEAVHFPHAVEARKRLSAMNNYRYFAQKHGLSISEVLMKDLFTAARMMDQTIIA